MWPQRRSRGKVAFALTLSVTQIADLRVAGNVREPDVHRPVPLGELRNIGPEPYVCYASTCRRSLQVVGLTDQKARPIS